MAEDGEGNLSRQIRRRWRVSTNTEKRRIKELKRKKLESVKDTSNVEDILTRGKVMNEMRKFRRGGGTRNAFHTFFHRHALRHLFHCLLTHFLATVSQTSLSNGFTASLYNILSTKLFNVPTIILFYDLFNDLSLVLSFDFSNDTSAILSAIIYAIFVTVSPAGLLAACFAEPYSIQIFTNLAANLPAKPTSNYFTVTRNIIIGWALLSLTSFMFDGIPPAGTASLFVQAFMTDWLITASLGLLLQDRVGLHRARALPRATLQFWQHNLWSPPISRIMKELVRCEKPQRRPNGVYR